MPVACADAYAAHVSRPPIVIGSDDDDDDDDLNRWAENLTPAEREKLAATARDAMRRLSAAMSPKVDLGGIIRADALMKSALGNIQLPTGAALKPLIESQKRWQKQMRVINSDALKSTTRIQEQMRLLTANLTKNLDFGVDRAADNIAKAFAAQQRDLWKTLEPALKRLKRAYYPPNLRDIDDIDLTEVRSVGILDGIALYCVPRASIARSILRADTAAKRRAILGNKRREIAADCRAALSIVDSKRFAPYGKMLALSLDALDAEQFAASQALTSNVLDSLVFERWGERKQKDWAKFLPDSNGRRADGVEMAFHDYLATAPLKQAFQHFDRADKQSTPRDTYSRHATAHTVSGWQYSRRNAVQAVMAATSLLVFLEERQAVL